ncbi:MAG: 1-deoxy-D-xylulose-5-phosphate reductoisomerase [Clostridiales bacterium]|nr:1-deoxy-D-xylulose-5-phosphate reductoisomerase [Clostridiales bacterium]
MKKIVILGSTGSIGTQALDIIRSSNRFEVFGLTCNTSIDKIIEQSLEFQPKFVVVHDESMRKPLKIALSHTMIKVLSGMEGMLELVSHPEVDIVLTSVVGNIGLEPTIEAIKSKKTIALANKETLVTAGEIIMPLAAKHNVEIFPVDSEHSAIFQCLNGENKSTVDKLILTASGGAFRNFSKTEIINKKAVEALKHPNWTMGRKITIDSATLMNKGLEFIEAHWLFGVPASQIEVLVHPQSIIHSMVQFKDHSIVAQLGVPDMRVPIIYALDYPERFSNDVNALDFNEIASLTFDRPDYDRFPCLKIAMDALEMGGIMPTVMNAANEILVDAYLKDQIKFYDISDYIGNALNTFKNIDTPKLEDILETDLQTRIYIRSLIKK